MAIRPVESQYKRTAYIADAGGPRTERTLEVQRWQIPLLPADCRTATSTQGRTLKKGCLMHLGKLAQIAEDAWWLNVYTMLSRVTTLDDILLVELPPRELFAQGPPASIRARLANLAERCAATSATTEDVLGGLGWLPTLEEMLVELNQP